MTPNLSPMEDLVMEVLIARVVRLGEPFWPFSRTPAITRTLGSLQRMGLLSYEAHNTPDAWRVWITTEGRALALPSYVPPAERGRRSADPEIVERACQVMHDAYEAAAPTAGWKTQESSRKPWSDVPEPNKATMRVAVGALLDYLDRAKEA